MNAAPHSPTAMPNIEFIPGANKKKQLPNHTNTYHAQDDICYQPFAGLQDIEFAVLYSSR